MAFTQNVAMSVTDLPRDPHQMLLHELHRENREDALKVDLIGGRPVDQRVGASDQYLVLDGSNRNKGASNLEEGRFVFDIQNGTGTAEEIIGVHDELHTISEIEFQSFPMPSIKINFLVNSSDDDVTATATPTPCGTFVSMNQLFYTNQLYSQFPVLEAIPNPTPPPTTIALPGTTTPRFQASVNRFEVQVAETSLQSFPDPCGFRHNFAFDLVYMNNQVYANPVSPVFVFTDPIVTLSRLTLTFFDAYRCVPLHFHPESISNVRVGAFPATTPLAPGVHFYLNVFFSTNLPPFNNGDSLYISPTDAFGKLTPHRCFDDKIYKFITSCGLNAPGVSDYPLVAYDLSPVIFDAGPPAVTLKNDAGVPYWSTQSNPYVRYPISYNALTNITPLPTNNITFLHTATDAALYGFSTYDPLREIIILVSNLPAQDANTQNIFTCMNSRGVLFKYGSQDTDKVQINTCQMSVYLDKLVASPALVVPLQNSDYYGYYNIKNMTKDFRFAPNPGDPTNNAIKLTSAKPLTDISYNNYQSDPGLFSWTKKNLIPNIDEIRTCVPRNHLRLPVRVRRILRRVTQLGGL